jgi:excisionase family DNA binding protein
LWRGRIDQVNTETAAQMLGVSPRTIFTMTKSGELPSRKIGRRRVIPVAAIHAFLNDGIENNPISGDNTGRKIAK